MHFKSTRSAAAAAAKGFRSTTRSSTYRRPESSPHCLQKPRFVAASCLSVASAAGKDALFGCEYSSKSSRTAESADFAAAQQLRCGGVSLVKGYTSPSGSSSSCSCWSKSEKRVLLCGLCGGRGVELLHEDGGGIAAAGFATVTTARSSRSRANPETFEISTPTAAAQVYRQRRKQREQQRRHQQSEPPPSFLATQMKVQRAAETQLQQTTAVAAGWCCSTRLRSTADLHRGSSELLLF
ncbi:hypothetical protein Emag_002612 [Eimeria magna]